MVWGDPVSRPPSWETLPPLWWGSAQEPQGVTAAPVAPPLAPPPGLASELPPPSPSATTAGKQGGAPPSQAPSPSGSTPGGQGGTQPSQLQSPPASTPAKQGVSPAASRAAGSPVLLEERTVRPRRATSVHLPVDFGGSRGTAGPMALSRLTQVPPAGAAGKQGPQQTQVSQQAPQQVPQQAQQQVPQQAQQQVPPQAQQQVPQQVSQPVPQQGQQQLPQQVPPPPFFFMMQPVPQQVPPRVMPQQVQQHVPQQASPHVLPWLLPHAQDLNAQGLWVLCSCPKCTTDTQLPVCLSYPLTFHKNGSHHRVHHPGDPHGLEWSFTQCSHCHQLLFYKSWCISQTCCCFPACRGRPF